MTLRYNLENGLVLVKDARLLAAYPLVVAIAIDLISCHPRSVESGVEGTNEGKKNSFPFVTIIGDSDTTDVNESADDDCTDVYFPDYAGWVVWGVSIVGDNQVALCLIKSDLVDSGQTTTLLIGR